MSRFEALLDRLETTADRLEELLDLAHQRERELADCDCPLCTPTFDLTLLTPPGAILPDDPPVGTVYKVDRSSGGQGR